MIQEAIQTVIERKNLSEESGRLVMSEMMKGEATPAQIGSFLTAMRMKGETEEELRGFVIAMRESAAAIRAPVNAIDMCGTGGDRKHTLNISTIAAVVAAASGVPVAKHGNKAVSSKSGSADLISALGIPHDLDPPAVQRLIADTGFGFMFAPVFHNSMRNVMTPRRDIGVRTFFNILGPMANPAGVRRQLIGVYDPDLANLMARTLRGLNAEKILLVHSQGMDEISNTGDTQIVELDGGSIREYRITPQMFGLDLAEPEDLAGGSPSDNARTALTILKGQRTSKSDVVALNAAAGIYVSGTCESIQEGMDIAQETLRSGKAMQKLREYASLARALECERQLKEEVSNLRDRRVLSDVLKARCKEMVADLSHEIKSLDGGPEAHRLLDPELISSPSVLSVLVLRRIRHLLTKGMPQSHKGSRAETSFTRAIESRPGVSVIGEYKPTAPGAAILQVAPSQELAADIYSRRGIAAMSVLMEPEFFDGCPELFSNLRSKVSMPMLFKDFIVSEGQIEQADTLGADAVLLIAKALNREALEKMTGFALARGIEPVIELHDDTDLEKFSRCDSALSVKIVGINSRDLRTLEIDHAAQRQLADKIPSRYLKIAESGATAPKDVGTLKGFDAILVGSMFMRAENLEKAVHEMVAAGSRVIG